MSRHSPKEIERCKRIAAKMTIENPAQGSLAAPSGSARFLVQRPEYPDWWEGWNEYNLPIWTSHPGHAYLVRLDELVDTLTRLKKHKPIAALYSPNAERSNPADSAGGADRKDSNEN